MNSPGNSSKYRYARDFAFLGLPNCTSLTYNGNGDFTGVMYFPEADFHLAQFNLAKGVREDAKKLLAAAADICPVDMLEKAAARAELKLLPQ